jgi:hypothetical protein
MTGSAAGITPRIRANVLVPIVAIVIVIAVLVTWGVSSSAAPTARDRQLSALTVSVDAAQKVLPSGESIQALAKLDSPPTTRTSTSEPQTVVPSTVNPNDCSSLWLTPTPATTRFSWGQWDLSGEVRTVQSRVEVLPKRGAALARFEQLRGLVQGCRKIGSVDTRYPSELHRVGTGVSTATPSGIPELVAQSRTTFSVAEKDYGFVASDRYYLVGNAVFVLSFAYDAKPVWIAAQVTAFEKRLDGFVSSATKSST